MDINNYKIYCEICNKYQTFSANFDASWTDLVCDVCSVVIATVEKKGN